MATSFARKIIDAPKVNSPVPEIYRKLTASNAKYPLSDTYPGKSYMPDFSRAVEMGMAIYRVNVPGFFYKCPGNSSGTITSTKKSGIVIGRYNHRMGSIWARPRVMQCLQYKQEACCGTKDRIWYPTVANAYEYIDADYQKFIEVRKYNSKNDWYLGIKAYSDSDTYVYTDSAVTTIQPKYHGVNPDYSDSGYPPMAILPSQREAPATFSDGTDFATDYNLNYAVNIGNDGGGISNCMIPIIPGLSTQGTAYFDAIKNMSKSDSNSVYCGGVVEDYALSETELEVGLTDVIKLGDYYYSLHYSKDGKSKRGCTTCGGYSVSLSRYGTRSEGAVKEARGTYVCYYRESTCEDKFYFVPAKSVPSDLKPITKIRNITTNDSCTYQIPTSTIVDLKAYPKSTCLALINNKKIVPSLGTQNKDGDGKCVATYNGTSYTSDSVLDDDSDGSDGMIMAIHAHSSAYDSLWIDIFANSDISGFYDKFVAQSAVLKTYSTAPSSSIADITAANTFKVFNPVTDG